MLALLLLGLVAVSPVQAQYEIKSGVYNRLSNRVPAPNPAGIAPVGPVGAPTGDPVGGFCLQTPDYLRLGQVIAGLGMPTLFVMEGGYAIAPLGLNVTNVLTGYLQG